MDNFPNELDMRLLLDGFHWKLLHDFEVEDEVLGKIIAPVDFITDLGSIPRIFWNIIPPNGKPTYAYVIHDYLYATQKTTRKQADDCLFRMMDSLGASTIENWTVWSAVRIGGWTAWNLDGKKIKK